MGAPAVHAIYAPIVRETAISLECDAPDVEEVARRITRTLGRDPFDTRTSMLVLAGIALVLRVGR